MLGNTSPSPPLPAPLAYPTMADEHTGLDIQFFQPGLKVWVDTPYAEGERLSQRDYDSEKSGSPIFVPALVTARKDGSVECKTNYEPSKTVTVTFAGKKEPPVYPINEVMNLDNMEHFAHLHPPALLRNVHVRFEEKQICKYPPAPLAPPHLVILVLARSPTCAERRARCL